MIRMTCVLTCLFEISLGDVAAQQEQSEEHVAGDAGALLDQGADLDADEVHIVRLDHFVHERDRAEVDHLLLFREKIVFDNSMV